ncbi:zinc finger protein 271 [Asbolus verrucosus]|uniref:Zinc finger protein 271 n=1 Tax=Asbolus verrucosus TaxID=1661398 RepID=A0A482VMC1_ASBVE|nr:zinc finger protein 271 [Asbolus verrucosus]
MPLSQTDILKVCEILAEQEELRVAVNESFRGASIAFGSAFVGALLAGPIGLAVGGTIGSVVAAVRSRRKFKSVVHVIMYEMPEGEKQRLAESVRNVLCSIDASDVITLLTILQSNAVLRTAIVGVIKRVVTHNMGPPPTTSIPTDLRVNTTALNAVALSSVAKYWVLTNLLPGPIPQVSVYGLPGSGRSDNQGKISQEAMLGQHAAGLLPADPLLLQQHSQIPVSISTSQGVTNLSIPTGSMHLENNHQNHSSLSGHQQNDHLVSNQNQMSRDMSHQQQNHSNQQNMVQVQVQDNLVSVIEDSKEQKDIIAAQLAHAQIQLNDNQHLNQQALTVQQLQHLQVQQVLDNVVRMENSVENGQNQSNSDQTQLSDNIQIVKDEKNLQNCKLLSGAQFGLQDHKGNLMDVRTADGSIVKISTNLQEQDLAKTLGVEMVQNMYKVNVDDLNQLLAYHEVFGKLQGEIATTGQNIVQNTNSNVNLQQNANNIAIVTKDEQEPSTSSLPNDNTAAVITGNHVCDLCGKMFQFRYQLIVHRRYHTERKPFTCQVCGKAFTNSQELTRHGKCHLGGSMFTCAVCFHVFANAASLERHMKRHSTDKPYNCTICGKSFARKEHLDNHTRCHTGETPYRCQYCAKTFTRKEHMVNHVRKHTGETPHRCEICKKSFTRKEHFMNHVMWHTGETPHHCTICGKKYTRKEHLANHMRSHTNDTPFRCEICGKSFTRKEHFTNHIMWHTGETPHRCDFCSKTFTRKEHLLNHVRQHTGESPHRCGFCSKSFTRKEHLINHVRQHTGETPFRCNYCPKAFTRKDHLVNHVRQHTGESPHKCTFCTKSFTRKEHLNNHVRQHTGESPHRCHFCSKSFTRKEHLTNHVRIHTGESPHRCEFCQKTFTRKEHLTNHLRQHTGETQHCCNVCSKPFTRKEHLINHMRSHTGERPFACTECGKSFPLKGNLLFHQRSHNKGATADRPFRCDLCEKDFMCKGHLVSHRRSHSGERPHACPDCGKTFVEKGNMLRHLRKHAVENGQGEQNIAAGQAAANTQPQTSGANLQIPQVSQTQQTASSNIVTQSPHLPMHPPSNHPVVVPTANGNVLASY